MTDTLTSAFFQRLDEHLSMHRFSEAVAMVQPPEAPTEPSEEFKAVFKTAASNAMIFEEHFETLLPLLNWFAHHGADPFDWPAGLGQSVYEDSLDHAWSHRSASCRFSDSPLLRWCWETPQAPELFEHSVTAQLEMDGTKAWFKSSRGRQLGSLVQLEGAAQNHVDWNRVWADGRSTVLMAVDMALNPMDFKRGKMGKSVTTNGSKPSEGCAELPRK